MPEIDPKQLAENHWKYIEGVLENMWQNEPNVREFDWGSVLEMVKHHYKTAFIHGFKHGIESVESMKPCKCKQQTSKNQTHKSWYETPSKNVTRVG